MRRLWGDFVVTGLAVLGLVVCLAAAAHAELGLSAGYPVKAVAVALVVGTIVVVAGPMRRPLEAFGLANRLTMARAALVALLTGLVGETISTEVAWVAVTASLIVALLDGVDGWIARRTQTETDFGARFDMEVDALLILVLAALVWWSGRTGAWVFVSGLLRYGFVAAGWISPWMRRPLQPSFRRKTICVVQVAGLVAAMAPALTMRAAAMGAGVGLAALAYSFLVDTVWLWRSDRREQMA